ncbi:hypothetical protein Tco_0679704 [Tanacetum coccineum]|uniref:No apical meristem-associated C-terminal domain-containing protein n=1 Tax=Tanacetum coccineum TaxID=301880 RepID=A0ABQ4XJT6_9ASTR
MGHGSAHGLGHGSAPVDDDEEDDSHVEDVSPSRRVSNAMKNNPKEPPKDWTVEEEITLCEAWKLVQQEADEFEKEVQEKRAMGRDRAKAKKKSSASSRGGPSLFVDLVANKFLNIKKEKWGKMEEQQQSYIQLKNRELDIREAERREAAELKREKLAIQR